MSRKLRHVLFPMMCFLLGLKSRVNERGPNVTMTQSEIISQQEHPYPWNKLLLSTDADLHSSAHKETGNQIGKVPKPSVFNAMTKTLTSTRTYSYPPSCCGSDTSILQESTQASRSPSSVRGAATINSRS